MNSAHFWYGKKVLVTGHSGFKGSWLTLILRLLGARVFGLSDRSLGPNTIYEICSLSNLLDNATLGLSEFGNVLDHSKLQKFVKRVDPEVIFHLAAQPLVSSGLQQPRHTYMTNVLGTVNLLECARNSSSLRGIVSVTSDKVYDPRSNSMPYRERDALGGRDPYSASKACADVVSQSYFYSYFDHLGISITTVRAGNVIGGGDWAQNRLVPDLMRHVFNNEPLILRGAASVRPWQHVLDPLKGYLSAAEHSLNSAAPICQCFNFGPKLEDQVSVKEIVSEFGRNLRKKINITQQDGQSMLEANILMLDSSLAKTQLNWRPKWDVWEAVKQTTSWYLCWNEGSNALKHSELQVENFLS